MKNFLSKIYTYLVCLFTKISESYKKTNEKISKKLESMSFDEVINLYLIIYWVCFFIGLIIGIIRKKNKSSK